MPGLPPPRRRPFYGWVVVGAGSTVEFVVGLVLFLLSLLINYAAQKIVRRYRISVG